MAYHYDDPVREALVNAAGGERRKRKPASRKPGEGSIYQDRDGGFVAQLRGEYIGRFASEELADAAIKRRDALRSQKP